MIPLKDFFDKENLKYLLENFDSISKEDIEKALKQKEEKELEFIKKFENKIILIQEYENIIQIYKFDSIDELDYITYDKITFDTHDTSFGCEYFKNRFMRNIKEFNFNPKDYREITKEEYKKYIKFYNETREKLNKTFFKI
jgi:uncharacterized protein (DUF433 family)